MEKLEKGDSVTWKYGRGKATGTVDEVHTTDVEKTVQGTAVKRKGSPEEPALVLKQGDKKVVKSASEVTKSRE